VAGEQRELEQYAAREVKGERLKCLFS